MIILLAPSKTLDFEHEAPAWVVPTEPLFLDKAADIMTQLKMMSVDDLAMLMHVSAPIALSNKTRIETWGEAKKSALWAYKGDVYKGMYAQDLTQQEAAWAQAHLLTMSGLYGCVRPYDEISPYRLEMSAKLRVGETKNLYDFWGDLLVKYVDEHAQGVICNLSSDEYAKAITRRSKGRVVTPVFMDHKPNGSVGAVPIYSKMMRGVMAHWMITHRIDTSERLHEFSAHGYDYDAVRSANDSPVFVRKIMTPLVF